MAAVVTPLADLDLLHVTAEHVAELRATAADVRVLVAGDRYVSGDAVLTKAREVAQFVAALRAAGIEDADVHLEAVTVRTTKGLLTTSSGASYELRVHCRKIESLADVIGAVAGLKEARLAELEWRYDDGTEARGRWLEITARNARAMADRAAAGFGVRVVGLYRFSEQVSDPEAPSFAQAQIAYGGASRSRTREAPADLGMSLSHTKRLTVRVEAQFRVATA